LNTQHHQQQHDQFFDDAITHPHHSYIIMIPDFYSQEEIRHSEQENKLGAVQALLDKRITQFSQQSSTSKEVPFSEELGNLTGFDWLV